MNPDPEVINVVEVMLCPACGDKIMATIVASVKLGPPTLNTDQPTKVDVEVTTTLEGFSISHDCRERNQVAPR